MGQGSTIERGFVELPLHPRCRRCSTGLLATWHGKKSGQVFISMQKPMDCPGNIENPRENLQKGKFIESKQLQEMLFAEATVDKVYHTTLSHMVRALRLKIIYRFSILLRDGVTHLPPLKRKVGDGGIPPRHFSCFRLVDIYFFLQRTQNGLGFFFACPCFGSRLAPLEGIHWVDMKEGHFHDYPMPGGICE